MYGRPFKRCTGATLLSTYLYSCTLQLIFSIFDPWFLGLAAWSHMTVWVPFSIMD
eukprot:m.375665 g.375665  ORF g.375665 m.375665 type:complete len:55 (+) comp78080_c0_seq1:43-207(+)